MISEEILIIFFHFLLWMQALLVVLLNMRQVSCIDSTDIEAFDDIRQILVDIQALLDMVDSDSCIGSDKTFIDNGIIRYSMKMVDLSEHIFTELYDVHAGTHKKLFSEEILQESYLLLDLGDRVSNRSLFLLADSYTGVSSTYVYYLSDFVNVCIQGYDKLSDEYITKGRRAVDQLNMAAIQIARVIFLINKILGKEGGSCPVDTSLTYVALGVRYVNCLICVTTPFRLLRGLFKLCHYCVLKSDVRAVVLYFLNQAISLIGDNAEICGEGTVEMLSTLSNVLRSEFFVDPSD